LVRWGRRRASTSLSSTLETVDKLDIGLQLTGNDLSSSAFFSSGSTCTDLVLGTLRSAVASWRVWWWPVRRHPRSPSSEIWHTYM